MRIHILIFVFLCALSARAQELDTDILRNRWPIVHKNYINLLSVGSTNPNPAVATNFGTGLYLKAGATFYKQLEHEKKYALGFTTRLSYSTFGVTSKFGGASASFGLYAGAIGAYRLAKKITAELSLVLGWATFTPGEDVMDVLGYKSVSSGGSGMRIGTGIDIRYLLSRKWSVLAGVDLSSGQVSFSLNENMDEYHPTNSGLIENIQGRLGLRQYFLGLALNLN